MTKEELESKFEDCFDSNTRPSEGGYGPDVTDRLGAWRAFDPIVSEYAKQQAVDYCRWYCSLGYLTKLKNADDYKPGESYMKSHEELYKEFIEQQCKEQ